MADQFEAYVSSLTPDQYLSQLAKSGWMEEIPQEQHRKLEQEVLRAFDDDPLYAWTSLETVEIDSESVYEVGGGPFSYQAHVNRLALSSYGVFSPTGVHDEAVDGRIEITFQHNGRSYIYATGVETDYFDAGLITIINKALAESGTEKRFLSLPTIDQVLRLVLVTEQTFRKAVVLRVIPPAKYFFYRDHGTRAALEQYLSSYYMQLQSG